MTVTFRAKSKDYGRIRFFMWLGLSGFTFFVISLFLSKILGAAAGFILVVIARIGQMASRRWREGLVIKCEKCRRFLSAVDLQRSCSRHLQVLSVEPLCSYKQIP